MYKRLNNHLKKSRIPYSQIIIATLLFSQNYCIASQKAGPRTISFPEENTIARIMTLDENISDPYDFWWRYSPDYEPLGIASGNITIPNGKLSVLLIRSENIKDLSFLGKLKPDDIDILIIQCVQSSAEKPGNECLPFICNLTGLKTLVLEYTNITNEGLKSLTNIPSLTQLSFLSAELNDSGLANISEIKTLKGLRVYSRIITNDGISYLAKLPSLERLFIDSRNIGSDSLEHITKMTILNYILFSNKEFCSERISELKELPYLRKLEFIDTQLSDEWLENLAKLN